jgi:carbon-monoxide dehydrogenase small subunit
MAPQSQEKIAHHSRSTKKILTGAVRAFILAKHSSNGPAIRLIRVPGDDQGTAVRQRMKPADPWRVGRNAMPTKPTRKKPTSSRAAQIRKKPTKPGKLKKIRRPARPSRPAKATSSKAAKPVAVAAAAEQPREIRIRVNGEWRSFKLEGDLSTATTLSYLLREKCGFTGLKVSCDEGACGACTVIQDGKAVLSCMVLAVEANGHEVLTIEGLPKDDPVVVAFAEQCEPGYGTAMQCGYCTPGFVMTARALLNENPAPTLAEVKDALSGNICRCGCYAGIAQAVLRASQRIQARRSGT